jgi:hypothetical protein
MLTYLYTSLFDSPAQTLVNTVNTVGIMGKGIAKTFRERYPLMFAEYKKLCDAQKLTVGSLQLWKGNDHWVLNFPTKTTWRLPSELSYIEMGLQTFVNNYEKTGIVSASFPPLGCGNGNLEWSDVRPVMERYLGKINIPIYIHSLHVGSEFIPEHRETRNVPTNFMTFLSDIRASISAQKGSFTTVEGGQQFGVRFSDDAIVVTRGGRQHEKIPIEEIENAWVVLREGILSIDRFPDEASRRNKSYLFPVLRSLPYVRSTQASRIGQWDSNSAQALFFARTSGQREDVRAAEPEQRCLSL